MSELAVRPAEHSDQLGFREVLHIFVRTYPFVRPLLKHLFGWVGCSGLMFLWAAFWGVLAVALIYGNIIAGQPVGPLAPVGPRRR